MRTQFKRKLFLQFNLKSQYAPYKKVQFQSSLKDMTLSIWQSNTLLESRIQTSVDHPGGEIISTERSSLSAGSYNRGLLSGGATGGYGSYDYCSLNQSKYSYVPSHPRGEDNRHQLKSPVFIWSCGRAFLDLPTAMASRQATRSSQQWLQVTQCLHTRCKRKIKLI